MTLVRWNITFGTASHFSMPLFGVQTLLMPIPTPKEAAPRLFYSTSLETWGM